MSQISKARERMYGRGSVQEEEELEIEGEFDYSQKQPRKFTVSSLTHHIDRVIHRQLTPQLLAPSQSHLSHSQSLSQTPLHQTHKNTLTPSHPSHPSYPSYPSRPLHPSHTTPNKADSHPHNGLSTPLLKTIHVKIHDINELSPLQGTHPGNYNPSLLDSHFQITSPIAHQHQHQRPLHINPLELVLAPPPERRHHSPFKPRECLKQWAESMVSSTRGSPFTDDFFPPARSIVFNRKIFYQEEGLSFERLPQILSSSSSSLSSPSACQTKLISTCEPTLLTLGKYTNPYLYSALVILCEDRARLLALFGNQSVNQEGIYHVNLCRDGVWRYVVVDDYVPVKSYQGGKQKQMLFLHSRGESSNRESRNKDRHQQRQQERQHQDRQYQQRQQQQLDPPVQLWSSLVEKAVAKIYGTYLDLAMVREDGMLDLFKLLTGAPASIYPLPSNKDFRSFLILIDLALKRNHIVTLESLRDQPHEQQQFHPSPSTSTLNLCPSQAYRILSIKKTGIKIRNISDPQLTTKLTFQNCLLFSKLIIYRLQTDYRYVTHKLRHKRLHYSQLRLIVSKTTRGYFQVWQNNPAYYKKHLGSNIQYQVSRVKMELVKGEGGDCTGKEGVEKKGMGKEEQEKEVNHQIESVWLQAGKEVVLQAGSYQLRVHLCQQKEFDFTVSYYGEKDIGMERVRTMEQWPDACLCLRK